MDNNRLLEANTGKKRKREMKEKGVVMTNRRNRKGKRKKTKRIKNTSH